MKENVPYDNFRFGVCGGLVIWTSESNIVVLTDRFLCGLTSYCFFGIVSSALEPHLIELNR